MAFVTEMAVRAAAKTQRTVTHKSATAVLEEASATPITKSFDVFLSHSIEDCELVRGAKALIEQPGRSVYVDWIDDGDLERNGEETEAAERLKKRMRRCSSLVYLHSESARASMWCPWEVGYFDALKQPENRVYVLPITPDGRSYTGQSYLALYKALRIEDLDLLDDHLKRRLLEDRLGLRKRR